MSLIVFGLMKVIVMELLYIVMFCWWFFRWRFYVWNLLEICGNFGFFLNFDVVSKLNEYRNCFLVLGFLCLKMLSLYSLVVGKCMLILLIEFFFLVKYSLWGRFFLFWWSVVWINMFLGVLSFNDVWLFFDKIFLCWFINFICYFLNSFEIWGKFGLLFIFLRVLIV